jgi:starch-binding outer membrane protein, SusD/RagB family
MKKYIFIIIALLPGLSGCEDYLDRKNLDTFDEANFWINEGNLRLYAMGSYSGYFYGYGSGYAYGSFFTFGPWADEYSSSAIWTQNPATSGNGWSFTWVRRHNIMIDRVKNMSISEEAKNHWRGVGRFFRAMEYSDLTRLFGDVPWYETEIFPEDVELIYKDRDPVEYVATKIMEDFDYAAANVRVNDGVLQVNRDVVLAYMSRNLLYLGTFLKYHNIDLTVAATILDKAKWAADQIITGGKYLVADDYRGLFTSADLSSNKEVIMFRQYETAKCTHSLVSYNNQEPQTGTTLKMVETYLAADGLPIKQSPVYNYAADNGLRYYPAQFAGRDPRMAATLVDTIRIQGAHSAYSTTGFLSLKFLPYTANATDLIYNSSTNISDSPVMRYGEVLLNYAEAATELGQFTQADADKTINKLRNRNIKKNNAGAVLPKLPPMTVSGTSVLANGVEIVDPDRDPTVSPLLWEIRRERCVELIFEGFRKNDLKRWEKYDYLKTAETAGPTTLGKGAYVDLALFPSATRTKILAAVRFSYPDPVGEPLKAFIYNLYDANMRRDWIPGDSYYERQYLNCVPLDQIKLYSDLGHMLTQNPGW